MTHTVQVVAEAADPICVDSVRSAALATLAFEEAPPGSLSVVLADAESLHKLNFQFRHIDSATDVLAFPDGTADPEESGIYFGDVVIALPTADDQARTAGHTLEAELALLTVHGVLHLLGYDHGTDDEKDRMWSRQAGILKQLMIKVKLPS